MKLYPFQKEGIDYALEHHYSINACEMGLGKTAMAISLMGKTEGTTIIVCPAYLKQNWQNEIKKFLPKYVGATILSYEHFTKNWTYYGKASTIIFDEAHYLKNIMSQRTKAAHKAIKEFKPKYLYLLTGTPIMNRVAEFYSLLKLCSYNPLKSSGLPLTKSYYVFADALSHKQEFFMPHGKVTKYTGLKNKPLLFKYLEGKYFRRTAENELDLPHITYQILNVAPANVTSVNFKNISEDLEIEYEGGGSVSTAKKDMAVAKSTLTAKYALEILEQTEKPLLIFSDHIEPCSVIASVLSHKYPTTKIITGATSVAQRDEYVTGFQNGTIRALVCTIGSMSTGWTLTATNRIIYNDLSWNPASNAQSEKRIHRIGQGEPCFITHVVAPGIDEKINGTLQEKLKVLEATLFDGEYVFESTTNVQ